MSNNKLSPELKEKWLEALKSGNYKKGKNILYNDINNSYCCLGVLCDVTGNKTLIHFTRGYIEFPLDIKDSIPDQVFVCASVWDCHVFFLTGITSPRPPSNLKWIARSGSAGYSIVGFGSF